MKQGWTIQLFMAVTMTATIATGCAQSADQQSKPSVESSPATVSEGGEGGEGGSEYSAGEQANADFQDQQSGAELLTALQKGGYVIYFRHAQTEKDYADQADPKMRLDDCETQRKLNNTGRQQAKTIGESFRKNQIPVGQVMASEYCRAWQTADIAFGKYVKNPKLNFLPFEEYTDEQIAEMKRNVTPLLSAVPDNGKNTVLVGHDDIFEAATGIYPDPQGMAYVIRPNGQGGFDLIANMTPTDWAKL